MAKLKSIPTTEAVGHVLCHDITQIIKGESKGPRFKKGHVVKEEDIREEISKQYKFIMLDEYQDTNDIQENRYGHLWHNMNYKETLDFVRTHSSFFSLVPRESYKWKIYNGSEE